ncbi:hypothetical protein MUP00_12880 [Candidatus Bathyarchaeota archaeon]|jgi:hypothetical protein|nr:hypothetical protein [Candidatus Bathyarchaeota archaeon]
MAEIKSLRMPAPNQQEARPSSLLEVVMPVYQPRQEEMRPAPQPDKILVKILDFTINRGGSMEYALEDATVVKFTPQLSQVLVQIDEKGDIILGPTGMPVYSFTFGVQTQVIPKNRTLYIARQQPSVGTTTSSITL